MATPILDDLRRTDPQVYSIDTPYMHLIIEYLYKGRAFFVNKMYKPNELILHIPLPLRAGLMQSLPQFAVKKALFAGSLAVRINDMMCFPSYENRIVISHPAYAIFENEPIVVIEFEGNNNYPVYYELN